MKKYYILAAATLALTACSNDENIDQPVAAQISATISNSSLSRASNSAWAEGDAIGVTMDDRYVNLKYTTPGGDGNFTGETTMYFKNKREPVTLTAYYPYAGDENTAAGIISASTVTENQTAENQPKIDFLYDQQTGVVGTNPNVTFAFSHKMAKLSLIFKNGNGADVSNITSYQIDGLILDGTFNTATGECAANTSAEAATLGMATTGVVSGSAVPSLILFPQAAQAVSLKISDSDGQDYACSLSFEDNKIASGNNYQFTITVNKTGLTVNESGITDWGTPIESGADADAIDPEE